MTGSSAGGLGAGLNYGMVQDAFGSVPVTLIDDSFPPFTGNDYITPCLQALVTPLWGLKAALPPDCAECSDPDGGLVNIVPYWLHKYPKTRLGMVSSIHDQIIRLFLAAGQDNCSDTDPNLLSGLALEGADPPAFDGGMYENGLDALRTTYVCTNNISSYFIGTGRSGRVRQQRHDRHAARAHLPAALLRSARGSEPADARAMDGRRRSRQDRADRPLTTSPHRRGH